MKKIKWLVVLLPFLVACGGSSKKSEYDDVFAKDLRALDILTGQFSYNIDQVWGTDELLVASRKDYVKYSDNYHTRSHVSFELGKIVVETLNLDPYRMRNAILHTLMMGSNASNIDLFKDGDAPISNNPFLADQVVDNRGQAVNSLPIAQEFATHLVNTSIQSRRLKNGRVAYYVAIPMIANHLNVRARKYVPYVRQAAKRYNIDESLIFAIMETESSFNPYAVSYANALGLMQIVPSTAGRDIFRLVKNRSGEPSRDYLFNPENNIDAGVAYLHILQTRYLAGITDPIAMRYAMISAYNSGAGAVLRVFSEDREMAVRKINQLHPEQLYRELTTQHPSGQARDYLRKVHGAQKRYRVVAN